ncbi:MAG TPA: RdgB/HAM1 family non-canonical purine NTP pyrophosphatase [Gammaproteobacteria bacterium]
MRAARFVLASGNAGKLAEMRALLAPLGVELVAQTELGVDGPAETGLTFVENALLKARHAALATGLPAIADDSGLVVDALGGAPGVRSARFAGPGASDADNVAKLLEALRGRPDAERTASFHCVLVALAAPDDPAPVIAAGAWPGRIATAPAGRFGFGYDPVFFAPRLGATAAELPPAVKNRISHRARAARRLLAALRAARGGVS